MGLCSTNPRYVAGDEMTARGSSGYLSKGGSSSSKLSFKRSNSFLKNKELQSQFANVLRFFEVESSSNAFLDVYTIMEQIYDVEKLLLRMSKIIFDNYDVNRDNHIDVLEFSRFWADLANLMDLEDSDPELYQETLTEFTMMMKKENVTKISFHLFVEGNIIDKIIRKYQDICFYDNEEDIDISKPGSRKILDSEQKEYIGKMESTKIVSDFSCLLDFLRIKPSANLIRDVFKIRETFLRKHDENVKSEDKLDVIEDIDTIHCKVFERFVQYIFLYYDTNKDHYLSKKELVGFTGDMLGIMPNSSIITEIETKKLAAEFMSQMDTNKDNKISYEEVRNYLPIIMRKIREEN